jgi:hypothetical protein
VISGKTTEMPGLAAAAVGPRGLFSSGIISYIRDRFGPFRHILLFLLLVNLIFNFPFQVLHHCQLMLAEYNLDAPYHYDPRLAERRLYLSQAPDVDLVITGDSRVEAGINPELIKGISSFNLALGAQTLPLTSPIIVDTLEKLGKRPRFLLLGITPDYMSVAAGRDAGTQYHLRLYPQVEASQNTLSASRIIERWLPAVFYRETVVRDLGRLTLLAQSAPPDNIWGFAFVKKVSSWPEYFRLFTVPMNPLGYNTDLLGDYLAGAYPPAQGVRERLKAPYLPDKDGLLLLIDQLRARQIEPLLMIMPFHDSFYAPGLHAHVKEPVRAAVVDVATLQEVLLLEVPFDTGEPKNFFDGHHLSARGAEALSLAVNAQLQKAQSSGELERRWQKLP